MDANWFTNITNMFFTWLDRAVYSLITIFYQLLLYLANLDLFGMSTIGESISNPNTENIIVIFSSRVYALLGIFMLFKVSFSILQYMVNPDDFSDKSKGFGKMITNILTSLVLIVAVPFIFNFAFDVQKVILEDNLLGKLILGSDVTSESSDEEKEEDMKTNEEMAEDLQFLVYGSFFSVDTSVSPKDENNVPICQNNPVLGTKAMAKDEECLNYVANLFEDVGGVNKLGDFFPAGGVESVERRFDAFGEIVNVTTEDNKYAFKYMPLISTVAGGFVVVMLLSFCMDVAVRIIKLGFLEIISPIPIVSYMDPKQSGKEGMLNKWAMECLRTFASLFIRIAIIYFVFFMTDIIANNILADPSDQLYLNGQAPEGLMAVFVQVMVILGLFFFAKEVPKLLENLIPGMSGAGNLSINPIKKINESPLAAGTLALGGAALGGAAANAIAAGKNAWDNRKEIADDFKGIKNAKHMTNKAKALTLTKMVGGGIGKAVTSTVAGGASAAVRGAYSAGKNKNVRGGITTGRVQATEARVNRDKRQERGYTPLKRAQDAIFGFANVKNKAGGIGEMDQQVKDWTRARENEMAKEQSTRDAQRQILVHTKHSESDMTKAMFNPMLDKDGKQLVDKVTGQLMWDKDPNKIRTYDEYKRDVWDGNNDTLIEEDLYNSYASSEKDALIADQNAEAYRKAIKENQDIMDIKRKNDK